MTGGELTRDGSPRELCGFALTLERDSVLFVRFAPHLLHFHQNFRATLTRLQDMSSNMKSPKDLKQISRMFADLHRVLKMHHHIEEVTAFKYIKEKILKLQPQVDILFSDHEELDELLEATEAMLLKANKIASSTDFDANVQYVVIVYEILCWEL